ncbi:MAG TPA: hypothetical protein VJR26_00105 [Candidatus Acidoferrales bacterium]|nr:hypothetical protein [Candidatus Acidoferrales bacterium]
MLRVLARLLPILVCFSPAAKTQSWSVQTTGIETNLRGVSAAYSNVPGETSRPVVWACGSHGVILRSADLGKTWQRIHVTGGDALDFRGIAAIGAEVAYVMSIGDSGRSRIYKTANAGTTWKLQYSDPRPAFFLDAISCTSAMRCFALGDPIDGKFVLLTTSDGEHWAELPHTPPALPKEGSFAASSSVLAVHDRNIYFATGGPAARVFRSPDSGRKWTVTATPVVSGNESSGIFSLGVQGRTLIAVGGDYKLTGRNYRAAAYSFDGGKTWHLSTQMPGGFRSAVAVIDGVTVAAGPKGEDVSMDKGVHWQRAGSLDLNALTILDSQNGWGVGAHGTIARLITRRK